MFGILTSFFDTSQSFCLFILMYLLQHSHCQHPSNLIMESGMPAAAARSRLHLYGMSEKSTALDLSLAILSHSLFDYSGYFLAC